MKINLVLVLGLVMAGAVSTLLAVEQLEAEPTNTNAPMEKKAAITPAVYVCPDCETIALKAGKCEKCGKDMKASHLLGVKDGQAMLCDCASGCKCDAKGMKDGKCACGIEVKKISVKGLYVCTDGCPEISDKPGKCMCGKELKKVEQ